MRVEWAVFIDDNDPDKVPHLVVKEKDKLRIPSVEEAERAVRLLNEEWSTVVRIYCRNPKCKDQGSWIERPKTGKAGIDRNVYRCEVCGRPMER